MIGKVQRGKRINGLIRYLFGPGECNEHVDPHVVAGFRPPAALEPSLNLDGSRDVRTLNMLLNQPLALIPAERQHERPVRHIVLRAAPEDPVLSDDDWAAIAHEVMDASGRAKYGDEGAVRWVAVRHAADHVHVAFNLARQDGVRPPAWDDYAALRSACLRIERRYGLRVTAPADGTAARRPTRAETEHAARTGRPEPARNVLRRTVQAAAAAAVSERNFFARLEHDGIRVRLRYGTRNLGEVTGYSVALPGHLNGAGQPVWFGGGRLATDLTVPCLRERWRLNSQAVPGGVTVTNARSSLRETVAYVAQSSRDEREFFSRLAENGLRVRHRFSRRDPGKTTGYAVGIAGFTDGTGDPIWVSGGRLGPELTLPRLRRRWATPGRTPLGFAERDRAWREASAAAARAAEEIHRLVNQAPRAAADIAYATADVLNVTARLLGNGRSGDLRTAADAYDRAARDLYGRVPSPTRAGAHLRAAARILADSAGEDREQTRAILAMIEQLAALADAVTQFRAVQQRPAQAAAAARTAAILRTARASRHADRARLNHDLDLGRTGDPVTAALVDFPYGAEAGLRRNGVTPHLEEHRLEPAHQATKGPRR